MIETMNERLNRWARWRLTGRDSLLARPSIYSMGQRVIDAEARREAVVPVDDIEGARTDRAVMALDPELRRMVISAYTRTVTFEMVAKDFGVSVNTLYRRLHAAHQALHLELTRAEVAR